MSEPSPSSTVSDKRKASEDDTDDSSRKKQKVKSTKWKSQIHLNNIGLASSLKTAESKRCPLFFSDIIKYIILCQFGTYSPVTSRWCYNATMGRKKNIVLFVEGDLQMSDYETLSNFECFSHTQQILSRQRTSTDFLKEVAFLTLISTEIESVINRYKTLKAAVREEEDVVTGLSAVFPIEAAEVQSTENITNNDTFDRRKLLMTLDEIKYNQCPLHPGNLEGDIKPSRNTYSRVTAQSPIYGLDCEMVVTESKKPELAQIAIVNESYQSVFETLVKPRNKIINYVTKFSGITKEKLDGIKTRLEDVQKNISELIPSDGILAGHAIENDLRVLKLSHPYLMDSSLVFNKSGNLKVKTKLKTYMSELLNENIQQSHQGHSATEDAAASLKLIKHKLQHNFAYENVFYSDSQFEQSEKFQSFMKQKGTCTIFASENIVTKYWHNILDMMNNLPINAEHTEEHVCQTLYPNIKYISASTPEIIRSLYDTELSNDLIIGHVTFESNQNKAECLAMIETLCKKIWESISKDSIFTMMTSNLNNHQQPRMAYFIDKL